VQKLAKTNNTTPKNSKTGARENGMQLGEGRPDASLLWQKQIYIYISFIF
jgi:hypothetical protein